MPACHMCDGTGYKDHAGFAMDPCDCRAAPAIPLCSQCESFLRTGWLTPPRCMRVIKVEPCPVYGKRVTMLNKPAQSERASNRTLLGRMKCGAAGRLFQPRREMPPSPAQRHK